MHRFLQPVLPQKRPEKRCHQWCRGARIGAIQFSSYCHSFPLFALLEPGDRATDTGNTEVLKRKETPRVLGVSGINAAFSSDYRSGETGIRTLGTLAGTPVFKTGAIGRSAISPWRKSRSGLSLCQHTLPGFPRQETSRGQSLNFNRRCGGTVCKVHRMKGAPWTRLLRRAAVARGIWSSGWQ